MKIIRYNKIEDIALKRGESIDVDYMHVIMDFKFRFNISIGNRFGGSFSAGNYTIEKMVDASSGYAKYKNKNVFTFMKGIEGHISPLNKEDKGSTRLMPSGSKSLIFKEKDSYYKLTKKQFVEALEHYKKQING